MRRILVGALAVGAVLLTADATQAQRAPRGSAITVSRGSFSVSPFAGYLVSQNYLEGPLSSTLGVVNAPLYGAQATLPLAPGASLVGTVGYSTGDLEVGVPVLGGLSVGENRTWLFDGGVELRLDSWENSGKSFVPLIQFGGGALRREVVVAGMSAASTDFMVSAGIGADFPIAPNIGVRLLAKDHYGKVDFGEFAGVEARTDDLHTLALSGGLRISF